MSLEWSLDMVPKLQKLNQVKFKGVNTQLHEEKIICYFHVSDQEGLYVAIKFLFSGSTLEWGVFFGFGR